MAKFVELKEAAGMLGVSPDDLVEMRSNGEIHGYRDGASWKFKMEEIERVAGERGVQLGGSAAPGDALAASPFDDDLDDLISLSDLDAKPAADEDDDGADSILVSEEALGRSDETTSSTIIGKAGSLKAAADSDLQLASEGSKIGIDDDMGDGFGSDLKLSDAGKDSDVQLVPKSGKDSDVDLVADAPFGSDLELSVGSDPKLTPPSKTAPPKSAPPKAAPPKAAPPKAAPPAKGGKLAPPSRSDALSPGGSELTLGAEDEMDDGLKISGDDSDLVLGGSDVTLGTDSGINLTSPSDSGLSLEEPLDLAGSSVSALELPEDEEDVLELGAPADPDAATQLKQDQDFMLTGGDDLADEDSGSQVIALEDSEAFDADAATMLQQAGGGFEAQPADMMAQGQAGVMAPQFGAFGAAAAAPAMAAPGAAPAMPMGPAELPEAPYSIWNVLGLFLVVAFLGIGGMLMIDVVRNMWSWEGATRTGTNLMDSLVEAAGLNK